MFWGGTGGTVGDRSGRGWRVGMDEEGGLEGGSSVYAFGFLSIVLLMLVGVFLGGTPRG